MKGGGVASPASRAATRTRVASRSASSAQQEGTRPVRDRASARAAQVAVTLLRGRATASASAVNHAQRDKFRCSRVLPSRPPCAHRALPARLASIEPAAAALPRAIVRNAVARQGTFFKPRAPDRIPTFANYASQDVISQSTTTRTWNVLIVPPCRARGASSTTVVVHA